MIQIRNLRGFIATFEIHAQFAGAIEDLCNLVSQLGVVEQLLYIAEAIAPALIAIPSEDAVVRLLFGVVKEKGIRKDTTDNLGAAAVVV